MCSYDVLFAHTISRVLLQVCVGILEEQKIWIEKGKKRMRKNEKRIGKKRFLAGFLSLAMVLTTDKYDMDNDGTKDNVYEISNAG